jgi:hypothetical protein
MLYKGGRQLRSKWVSCSLAEKRDSILLVYPASPLSLQYNSTARLLFTYTCHPGDHLAEVDLFYSVVGRDLSEK